ncbi:fumarylacetoacetate hydrolase family protein [Noviherbaspirillum saxi]|uniref:FAA hydrolase family protein n=1 Tax=Noviherbaspirillum saxi TaxID=2320863 RepID=A0A3A3FH23_9BURK|nr:fumarylacetoacetate hydrolase family protein [Noviherbaspirillum saxi]RJF92470.1 FAA hydrolase family protein [Noviherbaspirillum saxi]
MSDYVFTPPAQASIAVQGSQQRLPIRRVFCVGRNYEAHAREMGNDPTREPPFFFMKPADAVVSALGTVPYPPLTEDLHHEIEMVVAVGKPGVNLKAEEALDVIWGYGVGVDLTRRDLQNVAKKMSRPWDWANGFDASGPCSPIVPVERTGHPQDGRVWLAVNGEVRQEGNLNELIWPVADVLAYLSQSVALAPGDLIFTGTPAGVGALQPGDRVTGGVAGVAEISFTMESRPV